MKSQQSSYKPELSELEAELFAKLFETHDFEEGVNAFIEKRKPGFQNK